MRLMMRSRTRCRCYYRWKTRRNPTQSRVAAIFPISRICLPSWPVFSPSSACVSPFAFPSFCGPLPSPSRRPYRIYHNPVGFFTHRV